MTRRRIFHPSRRRLTTWLEGGDPSIDDHIAGCHRCAAVLEDLGQPDSRIGEALRTVLAPPADIQRRLQVGMAAKMQTREDLRLLVELLGLPAQTWRAMGPPDPSPPPTGSQ